MSGLAGHYSYWMTIVLMVAGMYILIARGNLLKKLLGLSVLQTSVYLLYIAPGKLIGGTAPIVAEWTVSDLNGGVVYQSPAGGECCIYAGLHLICGHKDVEVTASARGDIG